MVQAFAHFRRISAVLLALALATGARAEDLAVVGTGDGIEMLQALATAYNGQAGEARSSANQAGEARSSASQAGEARIPAQAGEARIAPVAAGIRITVPPSIGSGGAVAAVGGEREKLGRIARPLTEAEKAQGLVEVPLVRIPSAIFVHRDAGVTGLTHDQIADIFSGKIENWSTVGGPDLKIRVVRREETDSTLAVLRASMPGWRALALTSRSKTATTTQDAIETVRQTPGAIGFGPFSPTLAQDMTVLTIDGSAPRDVRYPSAVTLSLIYKTATRDEASSAFLAFATSDRARHLLAERGGAPLAP